MTIQTLNQISSVPPKIFSTGMDYLDNLLGGGLVSGSTMITAGTTGSGKSTLFTQLAYEVAQGGRKRVLYIAGEESKEQIKMRAERLMIDSGLIFLTEKTKVEEIIQAIDEVKPDLIIVDSLQMLNSNALKTAPGTPSQMRYGLMTLTEIARIKGITIIFIGHATKGGYIAGLQTFQHMVDVVLYLGINEDDTRFLQTTKNRFGKTGVVQTLYMTKYGLFDYPENEKPFGANEKITLTSSKIAEITKGSFIRPFALMTLEYLKIKAKDNPEIMNYGNTTTLTSRQIDKIAGESLFGQVVIKPTMKWLEKNAEN